MSKIYTDLNTVLTPYAAAIKKNASDITSLNGSLYDPVTGTDETVSRDYVLSTKKDDDGLIAIIKYGEDSESPLNLDSVAWENLSYRDIFITHNAYKDWGVDFETGQLPSGFTVNRGTPTVTNEACAAGNYSLKVFGTTTSSQIYRGYVQLNFAANVPKYVLCKVRIDRYVNGNVGVLFDQTTDGNIYAPQEVTDGFVTVSKRLLFATNTNTMNQFWIGSISSNLDAYIDEIVVVDGSIFSTYPTDAQMREMYDDYIDILNSTGSWTEKYIIKTEPTSDRYTDAQCKAAFLSEMNKKASTIGMSGTYYASASGQTRDSYSTPQDKMKLGLTVCADKNALGIWASKGGNYSIGGSNARTMQITRDPVTSWATHLGTDYRYLGGKGGSLDNNVRAQVLIVEIDDEQAILGLMGVGTRAFNYIYTAAKELCDMLKAQKDGNTPIEGANLVGLVTDGGGYAGIFIPKIAGAYVNLYSASELIARSGTISSAPTAQCIPASTSKIMTMLVALDYITDLNTILTVKEVDIETGSGSTYYAGDKIRAIDALTIMMMESSNTLAQCVGRSVGKMILDKTI